MAHLIRVPSGRSGYVDIVEMVMGMGRPRSPRGMKTLELEDVTIVYDTPEDALPLGVGRNLSLKIAAVEALQLIGAFHDPELMVWSSPNFERYRSGPGTRFWGAYGDRVSNQLGHVVGKLREDPSTRQAVITLWDPMWDNTPNQLDYPCTIGFNFAIIGSKLHMKTIMRSNDVWLGLPYDVFQFTQLQLSVADVLQLECGTYTHTVWSLHIYDRDCVIARKIHRPTSGVWLPSGLHAQECEVVDLYDVARDIWLGNRPPHVIDRPLTRSEEWYVEQLREFPRPWLNHDAE